MYYFLLAGFEMPARDPVTMSRFQMGITCLGINEEVRHDTWILNVGGI